MDEQILIAAVIVVLLVILLWQANTILTRVSEIHNLTNSTLSRTQMDLQIAVVRVEALERLVASLSAAKIVADTVAGHLAEKVPPP